MRRWLRRLGLALGGLVGLVLALLLLARLVEPRYAWVPGPDEALNPEFFAEAPAWDLWGQALDAGQTRALPRPPAAASGAVAIDAELLRQGRRVFYRETFGNEVFLTDILGLLNGPLPLSQYVKALLRLGGRGTGNLQVELAHDAEVGGRRFRQGERIDTGLDVPRGAFAPLGMTLVYAQGRFKVGLACAACHSTVDRETGRVVHGAVNNDLATGLLLALGSNSAACFPHATREALQAALAASGRSVRGDDGRLHAVPDARVLEREVDAVFLRWPPGGFDSTIDLVADPTDMPDSFTAGDHPFGWSGFAAAGPFRGLAALSNSLHAQNSDATAQAALSGALFGLDRQAYLAALLQNAAAPRLRPDPAAPGLVSDFFAAQDPTPGPPGVNETVAPPNFPRISPVAPDGVFIGSPGQPFWRQNHALAAWQDTLRPPPPAAPASAAQEAPSGEAQRRLGREVFERARCAACHAGAALTDQRVHPVGRLRTEPARARAFARTERLFGPPLLYGFDTPVPVPAGAPSLEAPLDALDPAQLQLAWAHGGSEGGYKTPSLLGLAWSAPYLHDGGVAAAPDGAPGLTGSVLAGVPPDPAQSLRALLDRELRARVVAANAAEPRLRGLHITGQGHEFWVDTEASFDATEQEALVAYLLRLELPPAYRAAPGVLPGTAPPDGGRGPRRR